MPEPHVTHYAIEMIGMGRYLMVAALNTDPLQVKAGCGPKARIRIGQIKHDEK